MDRVTSIKEKLKNRIPVIGTWLTIGHTTVADLMSKEDFDYVCIDMEHSAIDYTMAQSLMITIQANGKAALVRVAKNDEVFIKKALDSGADGVIVPMILSIEDVDKAVSYMYYPPCGKRGVGLVRANGYSRKFDEYKDRQPDNLLFIPQIEHITAIENLSGILESKYVDATIIGPYDLSGSMGIPGRFDDPGVKAALKKYERVSDECRVPKGYHVVEPRAELLRGKIDSGYLFLAFSVDYLFLMRMMEKESVAGKKEQRG